MEWSVHTASWIGERDRQEDSFGHAVGPDGRYLFVLADGMGGHAGGDIASRVATSIALEALLSPYDTIPEALNQAINRANEAIASYIADNPQSEGMGTTMVCAVVLDDRLWWASVGDSHLLLLRGGQLAKLNADHSMAPVLAKMVEAGEITQDQAATDPKRNVLRSAIHGEDIQLIDIPSEPISLEPSDIVLLASDGLDSVSNAAVLEALQNNAKIGDDDAKCLIKAVKSVRKPRQDNTSVIAFKSRSPSPLAQSSAVDQPDTPGSSSRPILRFAALFAVVAFVAVTGALGYMLRKSNDALAEAQNAVSILSAETTSLETQISQYQHSEEIYEQLVTGIQFLTNASYLDLTDEGMTEAGLSNPVIDILNPLAGRLRELLADAENKTEELQTLQIELRSFRDFLDLFFDVQDLSDLERLLDGLEMSPPLTVAAQQLLLQRRSSQELLRAAEEGALEQFLSQNSDTIQASIAEMILARFIPVSPSDGDMATQDPDLTDQ